jgi:uncharacterized protein YdeI (YjbR/CyaY-like superfamily)
VTPSKIPARRASRRPAPAAKRTGDLPVLAFASKRALSDWLGAHHASAPGVWLKLGKKGADTPSITYAQAVEVALAWGWIDGQKKSHDGAWWLQKLTPRGRRSVWSGLNRDKALALIASGEMRPPGKAEVERAKQDGRWKAAYDPPSRAAPPSDLVAALAARPAAAAFFATLDAANRYAVLFRVHTAKRPKTRADRIRRFVDMLARREKLHP